MLVLGVQLTGNPRSSAAVIIGVTLFL